MKKVLILIACLIFASAGAAWGLVQLDLSPKSITVDPCNLFNIDLNISGLGNYKAPSLGDFDVNILYDTSQMEFKYYTLGTWLGDEGIGEAIDLSYEESGPLGAPGDIDLAEDSLLSVAELNALQPDEFTLATLTFHCLAPGKSLISIKDDIWLTLGDEYGLPLQFTVGAPVEVTQTPEPCTLVLIGTGLAGARFLRRRLKK